MFKLVFLVINDSTMGDWLLARDGRDRIPGDG